MRSTRPDDFLSTVRTTAARPGQIIDVVVLTSDAGLLEALRSSAGSEHALWDVPSADAAVDYLVGGRCDVLIVDLGSLHGDVPSLLERLQTQFPELIFMATGRREEEGAVASLLSTGQIYRFLHKPISPGRAFQFLNAATRRYNELREVQPIALQTVRTIARKRPYLGKVLAAAAVLAAALAFAIWWHSRDQGLPATLQTTHVGDTPIEDQVKSKLGSAQIAYLSGRLIDPRGDNALEYYRDVLQLDANNADAKVGVRKVIDTLEQRIVKALEDRNAPRAVTAWTALQRAAPDHPRLDTLRAQLLALSRTVPKSQASVANNARPLTGANSSANVPAAPTSSAGSGVSSSASSSAETNISSPANSEAERLAAEAAERELAEAIARELAEQEAAANAPPAERTAAANDLSPAPIADTNGAAGQAAAANDQSPAPIADTNGAAGQAAGASGGVAAQAAGPAQAADSNDGAVASASPPLAEQVAAVASLRERGALISPAGNNAFDSLMALRERYPDAEEMRSEQQRLAFILLDRSRTALAANDIDEAATLIDRASTLIPGMQAVRALQEQLATAREQRDFSKNIAQAAALKRIREVPPVYPREAQRQGTEGWVKVEFTIAPDGTTRDLQVRDSSPAQVFDKAALDSVSKWRFEPIRKNGTPVAQRAMLQVRFVLDN